MIINNFKIENMAEPIHLDGSVETLIVSNGQIKQIEEEKNAIRVFARRLGHVKMRDVIIDSTATPDNSFTWCISFWEWSETLAERGVIDIQGMTFINPGAGAVLVSGVHEPTNLDLAGDYFFKDNTMYLSGDKVVPYAFYRLDSGYFGYVEATDSTIVGGKPMQFTNVPLQIQVPLSNILKGLPINHGIKHSKNMTGASYVTPFDHTESSFDGVSMAMGQKIMPYMPLDGYLYEEICVRSGTIGNFETTGSIVAGSYTLNVADSTGLIQGQWLSIEEAGNPEGTTPLRTNIVKINGNLITLSNSASRTVSGVSVAYQAPEIIPFSIIGQDHQGDESPYGV